MSDIAEITVEERIRKAVYQHGLLSVDGVLERIFARAFQGLVYPQIWEDPVVDMEALQITTDDHLVCIASGSCNTMSYLIANPASVTAVDLSPAHIALANLKRCAIKMLNHDQFSQFFANAAHLTVRSFSTI